MDEEVAIMNFLEQLLGALVFDCNFSLFYNQVILILA